MELKGKHVAVLAEDLYEDLELWYPVYRFREAGAKVTIVGERRERILLQTRVPGDSRRDRGESKRRRR